MNRLYFAAKAPLPGLVKTRLGHSIGMGPAATLYDICAKNRTILAERCNRIL